MGIAEELAAHKAAFVSLREVLETQAASGACDIGTAARWLSWKLVQAPASHPKWHEFDPFTGMVKRALSTSLAVFPLNLMANNIKTEFDRDCEIYGFNREELERFLNTPFRQAGDRPLARAMASENSLCVREQPNASKSLNGQEIAGMAAQTNY
ncbi:MAG: hypothetical protein ACOYB1_00420 [Limnohabitans sp.]